MFIETERRNSVNINHIESLCPRINFKIELPNGDLFQQTTIFQTEQEIIDSYAPGELQKRQNISYSIDLVIVGREAYITYGTYKTQEEMLKKLEELTDLLNRGVRECL